jgi:methionyl-tRNA formyltransferase
MRIALFCATARGCSFLQRLKELLPESELIVFSFPEVLHEPPFLEKIRKLTTQIGGQFFETRQPGHENWNHLWEQNPIDLMFAVSWRYMIPPSLYNRARLGAFTLHDSLLPEYRGFSPTVWAIINGEDHTGVSMFQMSESVDAGDLVDQVSVPIGPDESIGSVMERVTQTYLKLLERNLENLIAGNASRKPQDHWRATYTCKRTPEDNQIDWTWPTEKIYNLIRAVSAPYSGAFTYLEGNKMRIWTAEFISDANPYAGRIAGRIVEVKKGRGVVVLTGNGMLLLTKVQMEGSGIVCASDAFRTIGQTLISRKEI